MPAYKLGSSQLVHAPGLVAWAINGYAFPRDRSVILRTIVETWPTLPDHHARLLLSGEHSYAIEGGTDLFTLPEDWAGTTTAATAAPAP